MILDTSALLAYFDTNEPQNAAVTAAIQDDAGPLVVSPYVLAELDYLVLTRHGAAAEQAVLAELASGAWELPHMTAERLASATAIVHRYADQPIGVADASNIVLAEAYRTRRIATLDHRHFGVLRFSDGSPVQLVP